MITNIYLIRHGSIENTKNIFYGRLPKMRLSETGVRQMEKSARFLKNKNITKVFCSNLLRSKQSANIISKNINCKNISKSNLITEINSYMEGEPFSLFKSTRFDHYFSSLKKPSNESMDQIAERMLKFINFVAKKYKRKNIAVISHGDPIMILNAKISGLPMELDSIRTGKINYIKYGEIYLLAVDKNDSMNIKSVFQPSSI